MRERAKIRRRGQRGPKENLEEAPQMFTLMVRCASLRVSNHEAEPAVILRDALLRGVSQDDAGSLGGTGDPLVPAVAPPSIGSVMPVIQRDSSLARNSAP